MPAWVSLFRRTTITLWQEKEPELRQNNGAFANCRSVKNKWQSEVTGLVFFLVAAKIIYTPKCSISVLFYFSLWIAY